MKITHTARKINLNRVVDLCVDVHKDSLNSLFVVDGREHVDTCSNHSKTIENKLQSYLEIVAKYGKVNLRVICEPTGQYQNKLLRAARRLGCFTSYVNAEAVARFRMIESNDTNKTDLKDPRVIHSLGKLNKLLKFRLLDENYLVLRKLHKIFDECDVAGSALRNGITDILLELFCDYSFKKDFLYSTTGQALLNQYGCNPYRIQQEGFTTFCTMIRMAAPRARQTTLNRLWQDASSSCLNNLPEGYSDVLEEHLREKFQDYQRIQRRKERVVEQMIEILNALREIDPLIPPPTPEVISEKNLARFLAETGPLSEFQNYRKLMRYAGFNITSRQSGTYRGQNRISKKGRKLLRKVLHAIALPLVRKSQLYGPYYHRKKEQDKMPGNKAMTVVARQLLKKLFGWYRSGRPFDRHRFFNSEGRIKAPELVRIA